MTQRIRIANSDLVTISNVCSWPIVLIHLLMPYVHPASYFSDKRAGVGVEGVPDGDLARGGLKKAARAAVLAAY